VSFDLLVGPLRRALALRSGVKTTFLSPVAG